MMLAAAAQAQGDGWIGMVELVAVLVFFGFLFWLMYRD